MSQLAYESRLIQRRPPLNLDRSDPFFLRRSNYELPAMYIRSIQDVIVTSIGVIYKNLKPLADLDLPLPKRIINERQFYLRHLTTCFIKKRQISAKKTYVLFANRNSSNYYHWLLESVPRLYAMKDHLQGNILLIPYFCNLPFHNETLSFFNITAKEIAQADTYYKLKNVVTADYPAISSSHNPDLLLKMRKYFYEQIDDLEMPICGERIFISRKLDSKRKLLNQECVENYLKRCGFYVVHLEDYSFEKQVRLFFHAKVVVGIHGAGLSNLLFMQSGTILELRASDQDEYGLCYYSLSDAVGLDYYYQLCSPTKPNDYMNTDLVVDIELLKKNLDLMLS